MRHPGFSWTLAGISIAFAATAAAAQVPKKPAPKDTAAHITIKKDTRAKTGVAGGEVMLVGQPAAPVPCVVDSARENEIRMNQYRLDSIAGELALANTRDAMRREAAAARERMRLDSIAAAEAQARALARSLARGLYLAVGGGASAPQRAIRDGYTGGWNVTVPIGYDATDNPFGLRADVSIDHLNGTRLHDVYESTLGASGDLTVWSLNTDAKLRFHPPGASTRSHLYVLGGVGAHRVTGGVYGTTSAQAGQNLTFANAGTKFGWNAGLGAALAWGGTEIFVESRFFQVKSDLAFHQNGGVGTYTSFTPIVVGLNWF